MNRVRRYHAIAASTLLLVALGLPAPAMGQVVLDVYLGPAKPVAPGSVRAQIGNLAKTPAGMRDVGLIRNLLPDNNPVKFAEAIAAGGGLAAELAELDARRLNKMLTNAPGTNGTSLLSKAVAPAILAAAVEYGSILQTTSGTRQRCVAICWGLDGCCSEASSSRSARSMAAVPRWRTDFAPCRGRSHSKP